jgi:hypothetical protein
MSFNINNVGVTSIFNTDYPGNQTTGYQINGVDIGRIFTPAVTGYTTDEEYYVASNGDNIYKLFSTSKPKINIDIYASNTSTTINGKTIYYFLGDDGNFVVTTPFAGMEGSIDILLVGGGGSGGQRQSNVEEGPGGGGAGGVLMTTIDKFHTASTNSFGIRCGSGGSSVKSSTEGTPGKMGQSSSIKLNSHIDLFTVYGGAGGGGAFWYYGPTDGQGKIDGSNYASSGGVMNSWNHWGSSYGIGNIFTSMYQNSSVTSIMDIASPVGYASRGGLGRWTHAGGGGGGANEDGQVSDDSGGRGGHGIQWTIDNKYYGGGGGGGSSSAVNWFTNNGYGGNGGGGGTRNIFESQDGISGTGGGGGGGAEYISSGAGGSGVCAIALNTNDFNVNVTTKLFVEEQEEGN